MPKKGATNPYKGVPKSQWASIKAGLAANPMSAQSQESAPENVPRVEQSLPQEPPKTVTFTVGGSSGGQPAKDWVAVGAGGSGGSGGNFTDPPVSRNADEIPPNLLNGSTPKLVLYSKDGDPNDPCPGFRTYWANDDGNRISLMLRSGWQFIDKDEVLLNAALTPLNNDLGSQIREVVGTKRSGDPLYAYAMKKPWHIDQAHMREREEKVNMRIENSLRAGLVLGPDQKPVPQPGQYAGGTQGSATPPISITSGTYR